MMHRSRRALVGAVLLAGSALIARSPAISGQTVSVPTLVARAVLPADTFAAGPASGTRIGANASNGRPVPFTSQPVQGFSAVLNAGNGNFYVLSDNGYGAKGNSADFNLRVYTVRPNWRTASGGAGGVVVQGYFELRDPENRVLFPIVNEGTAARILTGADFDIESFRRADDGTFWFGEEFGPYLLHTDATGILLEAPIPLPVPRTAEFLATARGVTQVRSPENPALVGLPTQDARNLAANLPSSRGFEGMALSADGRTLYPLLEGALRFDPERARLVVSEFDIASRRYTGNVWFYRMESPANSIGDMTAINESQFLVIERDQNEGTAARLKKVYLVDTSVLDQGYARKTEVVDLLRIADPSGISGTDANAVGLGAVFSMPFVTIESVLMLDPSTMVIINDNNYPFSTGRRPRTPDDNEFIQIRLPAPLRVTAYR